ncbi:hypothetical protein OG579_17465 [Williamsia herbipolensis]|uniref:Orotate phosphoribosyltransferase n=1 Tax=Williamsia herbipolensis TaxID=1603258 RepID=A0AAU4K097_9NOCA|nr:hypothetical protein [Williamsia herbipolensis]
MSSGKAETLRSDMARRVNAALDLPAALEGDIGSVDKYSIHADPVTLRGVAALLADQLPDDIEVLVGVEVGGIAVAAALALHTGLPWAVGRRMHGERVITRTVGTDIAGCRVAMVKDAAIGGGSLPDMARSLSLLNADVSAVAVGVSWTDDLAARFAGSDVSLAVALSMSDLRRHWA